ncbi:hypothetical protein [Phyllobacterium myrsinacearum]|uniref:Uncharacterized protein n=1 Tax=Phyllobacterium myrsinacearum TaxID=28101 RepID=A0A839EZA2_9HYPH|nr:hypothetical protein [Phyllobacterium myrsinacearum]MBA8881707.1 hypothetical protein [Phyllobacterium myrsinacearum]
MSTKFPDCVSCKFYNKRFVGKRANPVCGECDNGEFYEEWVRNRALNDNELMSLYGKMHHDN